MPNWRVRQPVRAFERLQVFQFPFFLENLLVIALFTVMFTIASIWASLPAGMGIRSVTFWFICITMFFNYMFVVVDHTSRGFQHIPKLSGELVFPTHDTRLFTIALLTVCYLAFLLGNWAEEFRAIRLVIAFFTYPLLFGLLVVHSHWTALLNPLSLLRTLYLFSSCKEAVTFYLLQAATGTLLYFVFKVFGEVSRLHIFWQVPLSLLLLFMLFRSLGVVLNTRGPAFGLPVIQNADTQKLALADETGRKHDDFIMELHRWTRVHEYGKAIALVEAYQREQGHDLDDRLFTRLSEWDDRRLAAMVGARLAERYMQSGQTDRALKVFRASYDMTPKFRFTTGSAAIRFLDTASDLASRQRLIEYMQHFESYHPSHPGIDAVKQKLSRLSSLNQQ